MSGPRQRERGARRRRTVLGEPARRPAFAAATALVVVSAIALGAVVGHEPVPPAPPGHGRGDGQMRAFADAVLPTIIGGRTGTTATAPATPATTPASRPAPRLTDREQRSAIAAARRFLRVYLRYEVGARDATTRAALRAAATRDFARELRVRPPRLPAGAPARPGRIDALELADDLTARPFVVGAMVVRGGRLSPLALRLARGTGGGWKVAGLS